MLEDNDILANELGVFITWLIKAKRYLDHSIIALNRLIGGTQQITVYDRKRGKIKIAGSSKTESKSSRIWARYSESI